MTGIRKLGEGHFHQSEYRKVSSATETTTSLQVRIDRKGSSGTSDELKTRRQWLSLGVFPCDYSHIIAAQGDVNKTNPRRSRSASTQVRIKNIHCVAFKRFRTVVIAVGRIKRGCVLNNHQYKPSRRSWRAHGAGDALTRFMQDALQYNIHLYYYILSTVARPEGAWQKCVSMWPCSQT